MGHFTKPILELIARHPRGLRTVEIADKVDCDPDLVEYSIRESLAVSEVIVEDVMGPNDRPAKAYYPTDRLIAKYPAPKVVEAPIIPKPTKSKAEIGIEFIKTADFNVVDEDLRRVMGLTKMQYPSAWLSGAMANGLVHRDGKFWRAGSAEVNTVLNNDVPAIRKSDDKKIEMPAAMELPEPKVALNTEQFPGVDMDKACEATAKAPEVPAFLNKLAESDSRAGRFTCALWSDGQLQIARGGRVVERLNAEEVKSLRKYLEVTSDLEAA